MSRGDAARRAQDAGTPYAAALEGRAGTADSQLMAIYCETVVAKVGAFSPRLVWEGCQAGGVTTPQLQRIIDARDWRTIDLLMFYEPGRRWQKLVAAALAGTAPAAPARVPVPQQGDPPVMAYFRWVTADGIRVGAAAVSEWFWQCPGCSAWAGAYGDVVTAKQQGLGHLAGCGDGDDDGRRYGVKIRFPGQRWMWLGPGEYVTRAKWAQPGTRGAARQVAAQLAVREPAAEITTARLP